MPEAGNAALQEAGEAIATLPPNALRGLWEGRDQTLWSKHAELAVSLAERAIRMGEPFWAYDVASTALENFGGHLRLQQLLALSLAQSGSPRAANRVLRALAEAGNEDAETLGLLARTHKDLWRTATEADEKAAELTASLETYERAFRLTRDTYPGINAATLALLSGRVEESAAVAGEVREICREKKRAGDDSYWTEATLAEAALICGDRDEARDRYFSTCAKAGSDTSAICSARRQARLLLDRLTGEPDAFDDCFNVGPVIVFAGHRTDPPGRRGRPGAAGGRFPEDCAPAVQAEIRERVLEMGALAGYASAASGSDILFLETLSGLGIDYHVVLPVDARSFKATSVSTAGSGGAGWGERFDRLMESATSVTLTSRDNYSGNPIAFKYANRVLFGLASLKAQVLDTDLRPLAVWDGRPERGSGGTAESVQNWKDSGYEVEVIDLRHVVSEVRAIERAAAARARAKAAEEKAAAPPPPVEEKTPSGPPVGDGGEAAGGIEDAVSPAPAPAPVEEKLEPAEGAEPAGGAAPSAAAEEGEDDAAAGGSASGGGEVFHQEIKAILFADVVGYSRLPEEETPAYIDQFLARVARLLGGTAHRPHIQNTWGDALFLVFDHVSEAGNLALELNNLVHDTPWRTLGLSTDLRLRIGLHAGPVFSCRDPVTERTSCFGSHVSRAARIEPITEEGQIYASEAFSALAAADPACHFICEYVGEKQLPKKAGAQRIYLLLPRGGTRLFGL